LNTLISIMKLILAIAVACLAPAIKADFTCDDCITFGTAMQGYLMTADSIAEQTELLVAILCPQADDPAVCDSAIRGYWSGIATAMYPVFLEANSVCSQLGVCKKTFLAAPTCDECTGSIGAVADVIESEAQIAEIIAFLEGDGYCGSLGDADCVAVVDALMPYAMPTLAGLLRERAAQFCCDLSTEGVCC